MVNKRHKVVVVVTVDRYIEAVSYKVAAKIAEERVEQALCSAGIYNGYVEAVSMEGTMGEVVQALRGEV